MHKINLLVISIAASATLFSSPVRDDLASRDIFSLSDRPYAAFVEYLESTGTQWIVTGINPKYSTSWSADIVCLPSHNYSVFFMSLFGYSYETLGFQSVGIARGKWAQTSISVDYANPTLVHADQSGQYFNGIKGNSNNIGNGSLYLFNRTHFASQYPWQGRVYSAQFWIDGVLALDLLPVRIGDEGFMLDTVTGKLFGNDGTGDFLIGPDIAPLEF